MPACLVETAGRQPGKALRLAAHPPGDGGGEGDAGGEREVLSEGEAPGAAVAAGLGLPPGAGVPAGDGTVVAAGGVMPPAPTTGGLEPAERDQAGGQQHADRCGAWRVA